MQEKQHLLLKKVLKATSDISLNGDFVNFKSENTLDSVIIDGKDLGKINLQW